MKKYVEILDAVRIEHKLRRMAYEIWEHNSNETSVVLVGVEYGGKIVAHSLGAMLREISPLKVDVISINVNKKHPINHASEFAYDLTDASVILVDDVANSGKTLTYALHPLLNYDMKRIIVAVLVDRKHKQFPIASDIVGLTVATTLQEHIEVVIKGETITSVYLS